MSAHNSLIYGPPQPAHFLIQLVGGFTQNSATSCDVLALDTPADCSLATLVWKLVRKTAACAAPGTLACDVLSGDLDMTAEANCRQGWFAYNRAGNTSSGALVGAGTLKRLARVLVDSSELACWVAFPVLVQLSVVLDVVGYSVPMLLWTEMYRVTSGGVFFLPWCSLAIFGSCTRRDAKLADFG